MNMQQIIDKINAIASIMAFDILPDGTYGEIRIIAINSFFSQMVLEKNPFAPPFTSGMSYKYIFQDVNFESFGYSCVEQNEILYSCANAFGAWVHGMYLPLISNDENTGYFCYVLKAKEEPDAVSASSLSTEVSSALLGVTFALNSAPDFSSAMSETAKRLNEICGSQTCSIITINTAKHTCELYAENGFFPDGMPEIAASMGLTPYETAMTWEKDLAGSDCLILDRLDLIRERDPNWYQSLVSHNVKSIVFYAIRFNQELVGFLLARNFNVNDILRIKETIELTTFFIGSAIANHQLLQKLEFMSKTDSLTNLSNRNALNDRLEALSSSDSEYDENLGILCADLNGLKAINDEHGHEAGDRLLTKAANILKAVFGEYEIYRIGGDEFIILCPSITEDRLRELSELLRTLAASSSDVRFAIGTACIKGTDDIDEAIRAADKRMYDDKKAFYKAHPEADRRKKQRL